MKTPEEIADLFTLPMVKVLVKCGSISKDIDQSATCRDQHVFMAAINWMRDELIAQNQAALEAAAAREALLVEALEFYAEPGIWDGYSFVIHDSGDIDGWAMDGAPCGKRARVALAKHREMQGVGK